MNALPALPILLAALLAITSQAAVSIARSELMSTGDTPGDSLLQKSLDSGKYGDGPMAAANQAFSEGRFEEAVKAAQPLAARGDADALFLLGLAHEAGRGAEPSRDKALQFYRDAVSKGHKDAGYRISLILLASDKESERNEARKRLEAAAASDAAVAGRILGEAWFSGRLSEKPNPKQAAEWWERAASAGDLASMKILASLYEGQLGHPEFKDARKAVQLYSKAAALDDVGAMVTLGSRLLNGEESIRDEARGRAWLKKAVEKGNFTACLVLGDFEENAKKDDKAALAAYERGKDGGQVDCMLRAADFYFQGRGTEKDESRGKALLIKAAEAGHPQAQFRIAMSLLSAEKPDIGMAYAQLLSAANQNLTAAQNELGLFYLSGRLGVADPAAAVSWLTRAAKAGDAAAQNNLAALYEAGAAGLMVDYTNAGELYTLAANQGHVEATLALARIYSSGGPVKQDLPRAWALASLVAERGAEAAVPIRDKIAAGLDKAQRAEGEKLLKEFKQPAKTDP